jgi:hypothetical protein
MQIIGRVARAFDLAGITNTEGAPSFAFLAKGGSRKFRRQVGLITCPQQNSGRGTSMISKSQEETEVSGRLEEKTLEAGVERISW